MYLRLAILFFLLFLTGWAVAAWSDDTPRRIHVTGDAFLTLQWGKLDLGNEPLVRAAEEARYTAQRIARNNRDWKEFDRIQQTWPIPAYWHHDLHLAYPTLLAAGLSFGFYYIQ